MILTAEAAKRINAIEFAFDYPYVSAREWSNTITLDGYFTLEDLEAIVAAWKRTEK